MNKTINTDVVVIGSGPAGYSAAFRCSDLKLKTILIERYNSLGGVCLNVGCIPSKALLHISNVIKESKDILKCGVVFNQPVISCQKIRNWKNEIIHTLTTGLQGMAKTRNITVINGIAKFITAHSILVTDQNKETTIIFNHAVIATGSYPLELPGMPSHDHRVWNSTHALEIKDVPKKLLIVGGGAIGLEMATVYHSLGSEIDILDTGSQLLPLVDEDAIAVFIKLVCKNFNVMLNSTISYIEAKQNGIMVSIKDSSGLQNSIFYDAILIAIGRAPYSQQLNLKSIGIECDEKKFIKVDKQLRTNISHIYAIGDVIGQPMLAHKGIHEGHIVAEVISGKKHFFDPKVIPCVAYTDPEIAWIGITEKEAIKLKLNYEVSIFPWSASGRAITANITGGLTKLIFDKDNHKIIGGIVIGKNASELLSEIGLAIEMGCDAEDISLTIHPHPTLSESIGLAANIYQGTITDLINLKANR